MTKPNPVWGHISGGNPNIHIKSNRSLFETIISAAHFISNGSASRTAISSVSDLLKRPTPSDFVDALLEMQIRLEEARDIKNSDGVLTSYDQEYLTALHGSDGYKALLELKDMAEILNNETVTGDFTEVAEIIAKHYENLNENSAVTYSLAWKVIGL